MEPIRLSCCAKCGQARPAVFDPGGDVCVACHDAAYGGTERHEAPRLFAPAPTQLAGQLGMELE